ncbi:pyrroloquinoline quinone biosynthesis protein PqqB [Paraburkholderia denitrificans]|uniref:Coenzyme PQQ synthesis protein B n=1 Tax=Paraburkholderia denitrificans TaxID=694025 RepID=A0ABW0JEV4_9BURK
MKIKVLGSSAGGGFPQWNCNCPRCDGVRRGTIKASRRTQSSIAVTSNGDDWLLVNASPDVLAQIAANPELQPARQIRDTGIAAVLTIDAQIDHVTGLLMLRERSTPLPLYTTDAVWQDLCTGFPIGPILSHYCGIEHRRIALDGTPLALDALPGVQIDALPLTSKAPPYSPHRQSPERGDNLGLVLTNRATGKRAFYAPGLGEIDGALLDVMRSVDLLLVDGTMWTHDEMIRLGLSKHTAMDMGHLPQCSTGGEDGMLDILDSIVRAGVRKVLVHINNTNPILVEDGPERRALDARGIEVAYDGMTFEL